MVDQIRKFLSRMWSRPAGTETTERTVGSIRPTPTITEPKRPNNASAFSMSYQSSVSQRPYFSMKGLKRRIPITRATRYQKKLPNMAPAVPLAITPHKVIGPCAADTPASGMITSDGMGGKTVSRNIRKPTPR